MKITESPMRFFQNMHRLFQVIEKWFALMGFAQHFGKKFRQKKRNRYLNLIRTYFI
jgi:hypothetical protein